jgi:hypothetical protein
MKTLELNEQDLQLISTAMFLECERMEIYRSSGVECERMYQKRIDMLKRINNLLILTGE